MLVAGLLIAVTRLTDESSVDRRTFGIGALIISALVLGLANAIVRPLLILFTLPLTIFSLGLFLLVINALVLMLVAELVSGFVLSGFWTAFFASIFIAILNAFIGSFFAINRIKIERI